MRSVSSRAHYVVLGPSRWDLAALAPHETRVVPFCIGVPAPCAVTVGLWLVKSRAMAVAPLPTPGLGLGSPHGRGALGSPKLVLAGPGGAPAEQSVRVFTRNEVIVNRV